MKAHFYGSKTKGYKVRITPLNVPVGGIEYSVANKAEAIKLAKEKDAERWNF